ncbi:hypothetical protein R5R35_011602 [Gryllus longicercus]|uniref:Uncharacterized protein n=1 Tax=Gryllus longicercus TaxID=2509291 RepID=A0AAN9V5M2_9ORTH
MDLDLSLNEELGEAGKDKLLECLADMQRHWAGCSATNVRRRKEWSELLNDLKKLPLKFRINEIRREISSMWDTCFKSDKEREQFPEYSSDDYSEHLLVKHRDVLEKLKAFYIQHRELIDLVHKYEEMWKSVVSIQEQSQNPERLFKNRGAQLLKEEHDRKLISKIPHMQNVILKAIKKKEAEGTLFLIRGEQFSSIIERHNLKDEKKTVKRTPMTSSALMGPSAKRSRTVENGTSNGHTTQSHRKAVRQLEMK